MIVYYNEWDAKSAAWIRELIRLGLIPDGEVDERSILDVDEVDLFGFDQWHFFAGIAGWPYALQMAGLEGVEGIMTGSPPCQPFSSAGQRKGKDDERHLAPKFIELVRAVRPRLLFGEQVASAAVFGKAASGTRKRAGGQPEWAWIDDLSDRLEASHYAVGASDIPAAGIGAPHIRQRTFFVAVDRLADSQIGGWREECEKRGGLGTGDGSEGRAAGHGTGGDTDGMVDTSHFGFDRSGNSGAARRNEHSIDGCANGMEISKSHGGYGSLFSGEWKTVSRFMDASGDDRLADTPSTGSLPGSHARVHRGEDGTGSRDGESERSGDDLWMGHAHGARAEAGVPEPQEREEGNAEIHDDRSGGLLRSGSRRSDVGRMADTCGGSVSQPIRRQEARDGISAAGAETRGPGPTNGFWEDADWLFCRDGKWRPVESSVLGVADGVSRGVVQGSDICSAAYPLTKEAEARVMRLKGYGNAIVPQAAAVFVESVMDALFMEN